jgi:hypothetical protein
MEPNDYRSLLNSVNEIAKRLIDTLRPRIEEMTTGIVEAIKPFAERVQKSLTEYELNIKTGWWYVDYILDGLPDDKVYEALKHESDCKAFTKLVVKESQKNDHELLREMRIRWNEYGFLGKRRKEILLDIVEAHLNKHYTLSIPVAMSQIDYLHHTIFPKEKELTFSYKNQKPEGVFVEQRLNFARHFKAENYRRVPASTIFEVYPVYHYFKNILYANEGLRQFQKIHDPELYKLSNQNNRGAILHGVNTNYSSQARSLKQILLIDKLLYIMDKLRRKNTDRPFLN